MDVRETRRPAEAQADMDAAISLLDHLDAKIRKALKYHCYGNIEPMVRQRDWIIEQIANAEAPKRPRPTILISIDE